jgi:hypothetical protein
MSTRSTAQRPRGLALLLALIVLSFGATAAFAGAPAARLFDSPPPMPPANDNLAAAVEITSAPFSAAVSNVDATMEPGEPQICDLSRSVWYKFAPENLATWRATTTGTAYYGAVLAVWRSNLAAPAVGDLQFLTCGGYSPTLNFNTEPGYTYYFQLGTNMYSNGGGDLTFGLEMLPAPANDHFADATVAPGVPFADTISMAGATVEPDEPRSTCSYGTQTNSAWYRYTATANGSITARAYAYNGWYSNILSAYTGDALGNLTQVACRTSGYDALVVGMQAGVTYYFQIVNIYPYEAGDLNFTLETTPPPTADFYYSPADPSKYDTINFCDNSYDPMYTTITVQHWDFGEGQQGAGYCVPWQYKTDGAYMVQHDIQTVDGRTASVTKEVVVATHDVAITKFTVPTSASAGQTRQITVGMRNYNYTENVAVQLLKSTASGWTEVGTSRQQVAVRSGNRTTDFTFNYTFTSDDVKLGKVTFKANAMIEAARDALPADNEAISAPVKVSGKK